MKQNWHKQMVKNSIPSDISKLSFEDALEQLERIVRELEEGSSELDASIKDYERGAHLKKHCEMKLQEAQQRVDKVILDSGGNVQIETVDLE